MLVVICEEVILLQWHKVSANLRIRQWPPYSTMPIAVAFSGMWSTAHVLPTHKVTAFGKLFVMAGLAATAA